MASNTQPSQAMNRTSHWYRVTPDRHDCVLVGKMKSYDQTHQIDLINQIDRSVAASG
jgi:hypothetical protein